MNRAFYLMGKEITRNYEWTKLVNYPYSNYNFGLKPEVKFWIYACEKNKAYNELRKEYTLYSISSDKKTIFEKSCNETGIEVKQIDLEKLYDEFIQKKSANNTTLLEHIPEENRIYFCSKTIPHIEDNIGTRQNLYEFLINKKDDELKLYINAEGKGKHNTPHCHVEYKNNENYCVLSLVDYRLLEPKNGVRTKILNKAQELLQENIQHAREIWNRTDGLLKFKVVNGEYTAEYEK